MAFSFSLSGKTVIISGGYGYLGRGIVENLVLNGADVWVLARSKKKFDEAFSQVSYGSKVRFVEGDVANTESTRKAFNSVFGTTGHIDALINNAFYLRGQSASMPDEDFSFGLEGTLSSVFRCIRECAPYMEKQSSGSIINLSSMYGMVSPDFSVYDDFPTFFNPPHYGAAKAGVLQLTKYYAHYLGKSGIRVNAVSPGPFPSDAVQESEGFVNELSRRTALGRIGKPEDLGGVFSFLCSDASAYITGQNLVVDGGWTSR